MNDRLAMALLLSTCFAWMTGCGPSAQAPSNKQGKSDTPPTSTSVPNKQTVAANDKDHDHAHDKSHGHEKVKDRTAKVVHDHSGWWCDEHGVPEDVCALCNSKVAADFQKKGDWCKEHDRPDSQCFHCHPELEAKFASRYEAKYGKKPPKPQE